MNCVIFGVDGTLAVFDADRMGHLVYGTEKHWDAFHDAMAEAPAIQRPVDPSACAGGKNRDLFGPPRRMAGPD